MIRGSSRNPVITIAIIPTTEMELRHSVTSSQYSTGRDTPYLREDNWAKFKKGNKRIMCNESIRSGFGTYLWVDGNQTRLTAKGRGRWVFNANEHLQALADEAEGSIGDKEQTFHPPRHRDVRCGSFWLAVGFGSNLFGVFFTLLHIISFFFRISAEVDWVGRVRQP